MKCLALFSGGLDSMLAMKLISMQGVEVVALHMDTGFGGKGDNSETMKRRASLAGASFKVVDIKNPYLQEVLYSPKFGYGKHFNPCIDCHAYMFKTALNMLESEGASFIITGEVLGQRPMSQRKEALNSVKHLAGDENLILRPLSAKLLEPTLPEINSWIDREKLKGISGRSRKAQLALAKEFGFDDYQSPGGGCLLTMENFSNKLKDAVINEKVENESDIELLKFGRHLRLSGGAKLIIGKNESDNLKLSSIKTDKFDEILLPSDIVGPYALLSKNANKDDVLLAVSVVLSYAKTKTDESYKVPFNGKIITSKPHSSKEEFAKFLVS